MHVSLRRTGIVSLVFVAAVAAAYAALLAALYVGQERLLFPGTPLPADHRFRFAQPFAEVTIPVPGAMLHALHVTQPDPRGLVFFLHGNAGNLATWTTGADFYRRVNYDLFILDYRGYGKSTGRIENEAQLHADVGAAYDAIAPRYRGKPIVVFGRSLGAGLRRRARPRRHARFAGARVAVHERHGRRASRVSGRAGLPGPVSAAHGRSHRRRHESDAVASTARATR